MWLLSTAAAFSALHTSLKAEFRFSTRAAQRYRSGRTAGRGAAARAVAGEERHHEGEWREAEIELVGVVLVHDANARARVALHDALGGRQLSRDELHERRLAVAVLALVAKAIHAKSEGASQNRRCDPGRHPSLP